MQATNGQTVTLASAGTAASGVLSAPVTTKLDIEHALVEDDPRAWSDARKVYQRGHGLGRSPLTTSARR